MRDGARSGPRCCRQARILGLVLLLVLVPLELGAAQLTFETVGELASALTFLLLALDLPLFVFILRRPFAGAISAVALAAAIVPRQVLLGIRLRDLQQEAAAIVGYVYEQHRTTGDFPPDLDEYEPCRAELMHFIGYERDPHGRGFLLHYWVATPTTSHWYRSSSGWGYYPD